MDKIVVVFLVKVVRREHLVRNVIKMEIVLIADDTVLYRRIRAI